MKKALPLILSLVVFLGLLVLVTILRTTGEEPAVVKKPEVSRAPIVHPPTGLSSNKCSANT